MVPELVKCDRCGRAVNVLSWSPVYKDVVSLAELDDSKTLRLSCKIDCPKCGPGIQSIRPIKTGASVARALGGIPLPPVASHEDAIC
jgi:hypothetical protein